MCKKVNNKNICNTRIDKCIKPFVEWLKNKHQPIASCCGHEKYPLTVVVKEEIVIEDKSVPTGRKSVIIYREIISQTIIPRTIKFYKRDSKGYYYIPEVKPQFLPTLKRLGILRHDYDNRKKHPTRRHR